MLGQQTDFAMLGRSSTGDPEYWLGNVCRMVAVYGSRRKVEWSQPISLQNLPASPCEVHIRAQWYERRKQQEGPAGEPEEGALYTLTDLSDYTLYHVKHVIMPLQLNLFKERALEVGGRVASCALFKLHDTDKRALDQYIKETILETASAGDKKEGRRVRNKAQSKAQDPMVGGEAEGLVRVSGTSRVGRRTTRIQSSSM
jgi:hypothetical protein